MSNPGDSSFENPAIDRATAAAAAKAAAQAALDELNDAIESAAPAAPAAGADAVAEALQRVNDVQDKYLRLAAEFDNYRKRALREKLDAERAGMSVVIKGMLDALDDLGRFAHVDPTTVDASTVVQGAEMVEKKLFKMLGGHGLEVVDPAGRPFDPALHEAITTTPALSADEDHLVAQVFQVGYRFNGLLLRPARVVVKQWPG